MVLIAVPQYVPSKLFQVLGINYSLTLPGMMKRLETYNCDYLRICIDFFKEFPECDKNKPIQNLNMCLAKYPTNIDVSISDIRSDFDKPMSIYRSADMWELYYFWIMTRADRPRIPVVAIDSKCKSKFGKHDCVVGIEPRSISDKNEFKPIPVNDIDNKWWVLLVEKESSR